MKCNTCGFDDKGTGDSAHTCTPNSYMPAFKEDIYLNIPRFLIIKVAVHAAMNDKTFDETVEEILEAYIKKIESPHSGCQDTQPNETEKAIALKTKDKFCYCKGGNCEFCQG